MPVSPDDAARLARMVREVYASEELSLLRALGKAVAELPGVRGLRRRVQGVLARLSTRAGEALTEAAAQGYEHGAAAAQHDLELAGEPPPRRSGRARALDALTGSGADALAGTQLRVLRSVEDAYQRITADAAASVVAGEQTRRQAAADALSRYARAGITGFVDRAGRSWDLASYAEMATRTTVTQAMVQGHADQLQAAGQHLVIVSDAPEECVLCRPLEGQVLTLDGARPPGVDVWGTLDEAVRAGLFHPQCRHSISVYLPGITKRPTRTADPEGDQLRQRQRAYERSVRGWKRKLAAQEALLGKDDPRVRRTRARLRARQAEFAAWREQHGRKNLTYRTSLTTR